MRAVLAVIVVLIVSGDCENVSSILSGSVLLPCSCPERDMNESLHWQMERPNKKKLFEYDQNTSTFGDGYKDRCKIFLSEQGNNCSLLLTNIAEDDQGEYRCSFKSQRRHGKSFVILNVFAIYSICQMNYNGSSECRAKGRYRDAEILWSPDGPHTSSPTTNVTLDDSTGLYHFTSILITELNGTSRPACTVKAKNVSTTITNSCSPEIPDKGLPLFDPQKQPIPNEAPLRYRCLKIIPIALVLGFFLVLWHRWKFSECMPRRRETGNCYCKTQKTNSNVTM